jgi:hypothetical protein
MRLIWTVVAILAGFGVIGAIGSCDKSPAVNGVCVDFCGELIDAMDGSDWYDLGAEGAASTKSHCKVACTESVNEFDNTNQKSDAEDCVSCVTDKGFSTVNDDWTWGQIMSDVEADCASKCDDSSNDVDDDYEIWTDFFADFSEDFDEHWSNASSDSDTDADTDSDADADTDADSDADSDTDGDTDLTCDTTALSTCSTDYSTCYSGCYDTEGADTDCYGVCLDDYCSCADAAGCSAEVASSCA